MFMFPSSPAYTLPKLSTRSESEDVGSSVHDPKTVAATPVFEEGGCVQSPMGGSDAVQNVAAGGDDIAVEDGILVGENVTVDNAAPFESVAIEGVGSGENANGVEKAESSEFLSVGGNSGVASHAASSSPAAPVDSVAIAISSSESSSSSDSASSLFSSSDSQDNISNSQRFQCHAESNIPVAPPQAIPRFNTSADIILDSAAAAMEDVQVILEVQIEAPNDAVAAPDDLSRAIILSGWGG